MNFIKMRIEIDLFVLNWIHLLKFLVILIKINFRIFIKKINEIYHLGTNGYTILFDRILSETKIYDHINYKYQSQKYI